MSYQDTINRITSRWSDNYRQAAAPVIPEIERLIRQGVPIDIAVDQAFRSTSFPDKLREDLKSKLATAAAAGYGSQPSEFARKYIGDKLLDLPWTPDGMPLSQRLHGATAAMRQQVIDAIQLALRDGSDWRQAARKLFDGYGFPEIIGRAQLPDYLDGLAKLARRQSLSPKELQQFDALVKQAKRQLSTMAANDAPNRALKASYRQLVQAVENGSDKAIGKAIYVTINERSRFYAERIARTELSRAWSEGFWAKHYNDADMIGVRWVLGSRHPKFDICDFHANANLYGMGSGAYPKASNPQHPAHPHCTCRLIPIYRGETPAPDDSNVRELGDKHLDSLTDEERQALLTQGGEKAWRQGKDWRDELRNWKGHTDPMTRIKPVDFNPPPPVTPPVTTPAPAPVQVPTVRPIDKDLPNLPQTRRDQLAAEYEAAPAPMRRIMEQVTTDTKYGEISAKATSHYSWGNQVNMSIGKTGEAYNRTFWHEIGHAVDHQLTKKLGAGNWTASSSTWKGVLTDFQRAIRADVDKFRKLTYNELTKKTPKALAKQALREKVFSGVSYTGAPFRDNAGVSDIFACATKNTIRGRWGHSNAYLKLGQERAPMEIFANLWQLHLQHDTAAIQFLKETMPQTVAEFEKIVAKYGGV